MIECQVEGGFKLGCIQFIPHRNKLPKNSLKRQRAPATQLAIDSPITRSIGINPFPGSL